MPRTTDYHEFLSAEDGDHNEILALYTLLQRLEAGADKTEEGSYRSELGRGGVHLVYGTSDTIMVLSSAAQISSMLRHIEHHYAADHDGSVECWAGFQNAIGNPNS
jgi:hypothetical protein